MLQLGKYGITSSADFSVYLACHMSQPELGILGIMGNISVQGTF